MDEEHCVIAESNRICEIHTPQINAVTRLFNMSCHPYGMTLQNYDFFPNQQKKVHPTLQTPG